MDRVERLFPNPDIGNNTGSMDDRLVGAIVEVCFGHTFPEAEDIADVCSEGEFFWKGKVTDVKCWQTRHLAFNPEYYLSVEYAPHQRRLVDSFTGRYFWAAINRRWDKIAWYGGMDAAKFKRVAKLRLQGTRLYKGPMLNNDQLIIQVKDLYGRR